MDKMIKCKLLKATFKLKNGVLGGPHEKRFTIDNHVPVQIIVEQFGIRTITIISEKDVPAEKLCDIFSHLEKLLMMFDGRFMPLYKLEFLDSNINSSDELVDYANDYLYHRLSYYKSSDFCEFSINRLLDFDSVLSKELYQKWEMILDELDIVHQMFLYSLCDSGQPTDIKCSFLIELAEPLVEITKEYRGIFEKLKPGEKGTVLKDCIKALIECYGDEIFRVELEKNRDDFYQIMKNSRVRIMHIKRKNIGRYFSGKESVLYSVKIYLLYRKIIFELLGIDLTEYKDKLYRCVDYWNKRYDVLSNFLLKLD